jgi:hydroxymethylpyrimidine/phosphomethylpyrimidine kinase
MVRQQIEAVFEESPPRAVKTGMLFSQGIIKEAAGFFARAGCPPLVVDPVMVATSGAPLLEPSAMAAMRKLLPLARIITPNLDEAAWLLERRIPSVEAMRQTARDLHGRYGCAVLVKGGHLRGVRAAVDIFYDGRLELLLEAPRIMGISTHGTGCTYSAAIAACLARGRALPQAVQSAKEFITRAIADSRRVGRHFVLGTALRVG